jgi:hypothetical protein
MDLFISSDLKIDADEFAVAWNQNLESLFIAEANTELKSSCWLFASNPELLGHEYVELVPFDDASRFLDPMFKELIQNPRFRDRMKYPFEEVIKDRIIEILMGRSESKAAPPLEVKVIQTGYFSFILVRPI